MSYTNHSFFYKKEIYILNIKIIFEKKVKMDTDMTELFTCEEKRNQNLKINYVLPFKILKYLLISAEAHTTNSLYYVRAICLEKLSHKRIVQGQTVNQ